MQSGFVIVIVFNAVQLLKAPDSMLSTLRGTVILVRETQPLNALDPITLTLSEITTLSSALQPLKVLELMVSTPSGIIIFVRPVQTLNAWLPIVVTLSGISISLRLVQL